MHAIAKTRPAAPLLSRWPMLVALALLAGSLLLFWPGLATYDTVVQYQQVLSGSYDDWHPPVMARLWSLLDPLMHGTPPMLILQLAAYWLGLGLLAQALGGRKAIILLAMGATPFLLGWMGVIVKDSQMLGALVCAAGLIGHYRLRDRPVPVPALAGAILCLLYATLVRANAAFSTVPLALMLLRGPQSPWTRFILIMTAIPAALLISQPVNHNLLGAQDSGVRRSEPLYDIAAISARSGASVAGLSPAAGRSLASHHCVKPLFWDPLGSMPACQSATRPLANRAIGQLYLDLAVAAAEHPFAYLEHRLAHLNSTGRWLVAFRWPLGGAPFKAEPNDIGLAPLPCCAAQNWQWAASWTVETPVGWPIFWVAMAVWGFWMALGRAPGAGRDLAFALFVSALCQEASFAVLSISSDLRYHLWPMLATALGWLILWERPMVWRGRGVAAAAIAFLLLSGTISRMTLPLPPKHYDELMK